MKLTRQRKLWLSMVLAGPGAAALTMYIFVSLPAGQGADNAFARFTPAEGEARNALEASLRAWQKGEPPGRIGGFDNPSVVLIDNCRQPGQTLERFAILGEAAGDGPRCLAVRVVLRNPDEEKSLRFVIYGVDPLWVYRYEDYEMLMHWECGREERERKAAAAASKNSE